jgi:hypothetical protein
MRIRNIFLAAIACAVLFVSVVPANAAGRVFLCTGEDIRDGKYWQADSCGDIQVLGAAHRNGMRPP